MKPTNMKKIILIALLAVTGNSFAQTSVDGTADVNAEIVKPISITSSGKLDFGSFTTPETGSGVVTINPADDSRNFSATDMEITSLSTFGLPVFTVSKDADATYGVTVAVTDAPEETGGSTMTLDQLTTNINASGNTASSFKVGGRLTVPSTQAVGIYTGKVTVTVSYE